MIVLIIIHFSAWGGCNLQGGGKSWKGLSVSGVTMNVLKKQWNIGGWYDISLRITMNQGVKNYYSSTNNSTWFREDLPDGILNFTQSDCHEGNVVTAYLTSLSVGGGIVKPSISGEHGTIGENQVQLINNSANLTNIASIQTPPGAYMVGLTPTSYSDIWNGKIYLTTSGVSDGTYNVSVPLQIAGVSVWFQAGMNYWDRVNGQQPAPPVFTLDLPLTIRISDNKPVDPNISCSLNNILNIDHGTLIKSLAANHEKESIITVSCNASTSGRVTLNGYLNSTNYTTVKLGDDITSELSASTNRSTWSRVIDNISFASGNTPIYFKSKLKITDSTKAGSFNGSAVAIVTIN